MATVYELGRPHPLDAPSVSDTPRPPLVKVITSHEFSQLTHIAPEARAKARPISVCCMT